MRVRNKIFLKYFVYIIVVIFFFMSVKGIVFCVYVKIEIVVCVLVLLLISFENWVKYYNVNGKC